MLIEKIIEFELRGAGSTVLTCSTKLVIFITKRNLIRKIFE